MLKTSTTPGETTEAPVTAPVDTITDPMMAELPVEPSWLSIHDDARSLYERIFSEVGDIDSILNEAQLQANNAWGGDVAEHIRGSAVGMVYSRLGTRRGELIAAVLDASVLITEESTAQELLEATRILTTVLKDLADLMGEMEGHISVASPKVAEYYAAELKKYLDLYATFATELGEVGGRLAAMPEPTEAEAAARAARLRDRQDVSIVEGLRRALMGASED